MNYLHSQMFHNTINISRYIIYFLILLNQHVKVFASPQTLAKKLHPLSLSRQKNCTPSGFHGKKIAHSLAANLSEIAI